MEEVLLLPLRELDLVFDSDLDGFGEAGLASSFTSDAALRWPPADCFLALERSD